MQDRRLVICGNASLPGIQENPDRDLRLRLWGDDGPDKITLRIEDIRKQVFGNIPDNFKDLVEIATYVYCADQAIKRGSNDVDTFGENWRRDLRYIIPVRNPDFWNSDEVKSELKATLGFLSDDHYEFDFTPHQDSQAFQQYLEFNDEGWSLGYPEQVIMFSGGLDSLGGAIKEIINEKKRVVLVTHKSAKKLNKKIRDIQDQLADKSGENKPIYIGVRVNNKKDLDKEYTQRSRSFLYVSLGATIATMAGLKNLRFYENGVISLNLPISAQVVGGRATRTTHPRVIAGFERLITLVAGEKFVVENPFIWYTKAEVIQSITKSGCGDLIASSISCTHTWEMTIKSSHCGTCSQCIDRRFAMIAADAEKFDPISNYRMDIFTQNRSKPERKDEDKLMTASFLERANQVDRITDVAQLISRYGEVSRVIHHLPGTPESVAQRILDLYKRHAKEVNDALDVMNSRHLKEIRQRTLPGDCLLRTSYESGSVISVPAIQFAKDDPKFIFRMRGGVWEARFNGNAIVLIKGVEKGAEYIRYLLSHPHQRTSVFDIVSSHSIDLCNGTISQQSSSEFSDDGFSVNKGKPLGDAGFVADNKAIEQYREAAQDALYELEEARRNNDLGNIEKYEEEVAQISRAIEEAVGKGGRRRKIKDPRKNIQDSFRNAINRTIEYIEKYDKPLHDHLKSSISFGAEPSYSPEEDIDWEVEHIVNE